MSVTIDGKEEPVDMECAYVTFCDEIKLEPSGMFSCVIIGTNIQHV
jgi:ligand-binding sensor protein